MYGCLKRQVSSCECDCVCGRVCECMCTHPYAIRCASVPVCQRPSGVCVCVCVCVILLPCSCVCLSVRTCLCVMRCVSVRLCQCLCVCARCGLCVGVCAYACQTLFMCLYLGLSGASATNIGFNVQKYAHRKRHEKRVIQKDRSLLGFLYGLNI